MDRKTRLAGANVIADAAHFREIPLLDQEECRRALAAIDRLRPEWEPRSAAAPFFTLGAAAYLDGGGERYRHKATVLNRLLAAEFGWLLDRVAAAVGRAAGARTCWLEGAALPGFHIYLDSPLFAQPVASVHLDRQQYQIDVSRLHAPDLSAPLSFTLSLQLPSSGAGLNVWNIHESARAGAAAVAAAGAAEPAFQPYRAGTLLVHDGNAVHQAVISRGMGQSERRITLQGHAVRDGPEVHLYW